MKSVNSSQGQPGLFARLPSHRGTIAAMKWNRAVLADGSVFDSPEWRALEIENIVQDPVNRIRLPLFQLSWMILEEGEEISDIGDVTTPLYRRFQATLSEDKELSKKMQTFVKHASISVDLAHSLRADKKARLKFEYLAPFLSKQDADTLVLTCARVLVKKDFTLSSEVSWEIDILQENATELAAIINRFADMEVWHRGHLNSHSIRKRSDNAVLFFASWLWRNSNDYQLSKKGEDVNIPMILACLAEAYRQVQKVSISNEGVFDSEKYTLAAEAGGYSEMRPINQARLSHAYRDQFPNHWNDHLAYLAGENRKKAATLLDQAA